MRLSTELDKLVLDFMSAKLKTSEGQAREGGCGPAQACAPACAAGLPQGPGAAARFSGILVYDRAKHRTKALLTGNVDMTSKAQTTKGKTNLNYIKK